jgi:hypothetical protein
MDLGQYPKLKIPNREIQNTHRVERQFWNIVREFHLADETALAFLLEHSMLIPESDRLMLPAACWCLPSPSRITFARRVSRSRAVSRSRRWASRSHVLPPPLPSPRRKCAVHRPRNSADSDSSQTRVKCKRTKIHKNETRVWEKLDPTCRSLIPEVVDRIEQSDTRPLVVSIALSISL